MTGAERIKALLENKPVDRCPIAGWMHMPLVDRNPKEFINATIHFTDRNEYDFIKVMPNGHHMVEAYGGDIFYFPDPPRFDTTLWESEIFRFPINNADDLYKLPVVDPKLNPVFLREASVVEGLANHYHGTVPVLATVFSPMNAIQEMSLACFPDRMLDFMENHRDALHVALEAMTQTCIKLVDNYVDAGADGFFYAVQYCNNSLISEDDFEELCRPYDERILEHINKKTWFNITHFHGTRIFKEKFFSYDTQAYNWECACKGVPEDGLLSIAEARSMTDRILIGGTDLHSDYYGAYEEVRENLRGRLVKALEESKGRFIFAPGCAFPPDMAPCMADLLKEVVNEYYIKNKN